MSLRAATLTGNVDARPRHDDFWTRETLSLHGHLPDTSVISFILPRLPFPFSYYQRHRARTNRQLLLSRGRLHDFPFGVFGSKRSVSMICLLHLMVYAGVALLWE